jgi:hypothetical protein
MYQLQDMGIFFAKGGTQLRLNIMYVMHGLHFGEVLLPTTFEFVTRDYMVKQIESVNEQCKYQRDIEPIIYECLIEQV